MEPMSGILSLDEALEDVEVRFLYNLPTSELMKSERLFFQIEQAHWFYEDFYSDKYSHLPHYGLKQFAESIFKHCQLLEKLQDQFQILFDDFCDYRIQIPVYGCILLNKDMSMVVLVKSFFGNSWGFPKGKVNEGEAPLDCALRETLEETGFDAKTHCREQNSLVLHDEKRLTKLFIALDVPESFNFAPKTRKEVSDISFHELENLPKKCYGVHSFLPKLTRWITKHKKDNRNGTSSNSRATPSTPTSSSVVKKEKRSESRIHNLDKRNIDTFGVDACKKWSVDDMFATNAKLTGRDYIYDGNPHNFGSFHPRYVNYSGNHTDSDNSNIIYTSNIKGSFSTEDSNLFGNNLRTIEKSSKTILKRPSSLDLPKNLTESSSAYPSQPFHSSGKERKDIENVNQSLLHPSTDSTRDHRKMLNRYKINRKNNNNDSNVTDSSTSFPPLFGPRFVFETHTIMKIVNSSLSSPESLAVYDDLFIDDHE